MKDLVDISDGPDAIDHLVELLLKDPSRADQIKSAFRETLADESPSEITTLHVTRREAEVDADEFWDNFPI
jgi:hypothetical protein